MAGYSWGEQPADSRTIKLNTNENPYPPSPAVGAALTAFDPSRLRRYPPPLANDFRDAAARLHDVERDWLIATNGGDELLRLLLTTFLEPGRPLVTTAPSYSLYPVLAAVQDCPTVEIPLAADFALPEDFAARANAAGAGLTCVVSPHAPSGRLFSMPELARLAAEIDGLLLVDEAYVDFVDPGLGHDTIALVKAHDNLVLLRSLSKGYALAGLRFGYGIAHPSVIAPMLEKTRDSYNVDLIAQTLALAAIEDRAWAAENWAAVRAERVRVANALTALGCRVPDSQSNFVFPALPAGRDAATCKRSLQDAGILVRHFDSPDVRDRLRITIGTAAENDAVLAHLDGLLT